LLQRAIRECTAAGEELNLATWAKEVEFFCDAEEQALSLSITLSRKIKEEALEPLWAILRGKIPELQSLSAFTSIEDKEEEVRGPLVAQLGEAGLTYRVADQHYQVSAGAFFQVNRLLVPRLAELVTGGRSGRLVWDLYAGVGLFAKLLAQSFQKVVAVEAAPISGKDLSRNLSAPHEYVRATTQDFLRGQRKGSPVPDLIVVDPPRAGLGKEIAATLAAVGSAEIVYVSCDPSTLGRDLSILLQSGYLLRKLHMVDLFPQTFHLESVAVLERR
jgi:23S rRNA (uracil1939-C5)-methyltransferase